MRYDDASQAGSMANDDHSPVARPDVDALAPNNFGPASGNVITGAGTTTGQSGADSVGDGPGLIVAVQGAGGPATNADGNFSANGQYGVLSMDAQGNFNYVRNAGTPDGVQDVFNYTLADRDGQTSSTSLAFDIAKGGVGQAAVVPGTNLAIPGVVNLPAGVQMSDIHVVGRDLVINMPDGTQMVIPNGAVFVPQLVIGDVQLPPSNLAALLVESEPQPAAGGLQSSGGNFATDVPPLDPGVPLGDLIPPTELNFPPPLIIPVGQFEDLKPEAGTVSVQLDDDALAGGNPGGVGDDADSVNATGFLPGSGGDQPLHFDLLTDGAPAGFSYVDGPNGSILVQQVQNGSTVTVLTITVDPATGAYTVVENAAIMHPAGGDENNVSFVINYVVVDNNGDSAAGTMNINVDDDTPVVHVTAGPDENVVLTTHDALSIPGDGNPDTAVTTANFSGVFTGTTVSPGADGAGPGTSSTYALAITGSNSGLTSHGSTINLFLVNGVVVGSTAATAGAIDAGNTVFTISTTNTGIVTLTQFLQIDHPIAQDPTATGAPFDDQIISMADGLVTLTRSETVVDGDGDQVTGSATVNIGSNLHFTDDGPTIGLADHGEPTLSVDESDFSTNSTASFAANFSADFGADGPAAAGGGLTYTLGINAGATGLIDTLTGQAVVLSVVNGQVVGTAGAGGPVVFTVSVDASGNVTLDESRAVIHSPDSGPDQTTTLAADNLVTLTATATDFDGDTASSTLNIGLNLIFHDDAPSATATLLTGVVDEDGVPGGIPGGPGDVAGEATVASGNVSTLFNSGADQPLTFSLLANTSGLPALTSNGVAITYAVVGNTLTASAGANVIFTFSVNATTGAYTFTLVDQIDHPTLNGLAGDNTENDLTIALGSIIQATDADGDHVTANANGLVITVDDDTPVAHNDSDTITSGGTSATGNVITGASTDGGLGGAGADQSGADAPALITGLVGFNGSTDVNATGGFDVTGQFGTLHMDANGDYTYTRNGGSPGNVSDTFTYTLTDADGDSVTATLTININDSAPTLPDPTLVRLDDDALAGGNPGGVGDDVDSAGLPGQLSGTGGDGALTYSFTGSNTLPAGFTVNPVNATTVQILQGATVVLTITLNQTTGAFNVVENHAIDHPAGSDENNLVFAIGVQVTDADGDSDPATITINVDDDTPTVSANGTVQLDDDALAGGNAGGTGDDPNSVNTTGTLGHSFGADGAGSIAYLTSGAPSGFSYALQGNGDLWVMQGATHVLTLTVNSTTGAYTVTQVAPINHVAGGDENNQLFTVSYQVTDHDGDSATGSIVINVDDDTPVAAIATTGQHVALDESAGNQADSNDVTGPLAVFAAVANVGDDPDVAGTGPIQFATNVNAIVSSTGSSVGADSPGTTVFSLSLSASGVDSGLNTTSGQDIFLFVENGIVVGRVGNASGPAAFAISIDQTGHLSMVEYLSIQHPDATNPDDMVSITNGAILATVTVTDADGDSAAQSVAIGNLIQFQDSGPILTAADNINIQNSGDVAATGGFHYNLGADGAPTNNNVFTSVTGSATVNGNAVTNYTISETSENATTAVYTFSFDYDTGSGGTAHETGTLTFDKVAGTYTVDLADPISGFSILATAGAPASAFVNYNSDGTISSGPSNIATVQLDTNFFIQFTGVADKTGSDHLTTTVAPGGTFNPQSGVAFTALELFDQADATVTVSSSAAGVAGNTIQGGEVLDFNLYSTDPTSNTALVPTQNASTMFIELDGVGGSEDMIVVLKLLDTSTGQYSEVALMVQNGDIITSNATLAGTAFSGIVLDNNDGIIIIEPNDYQNGNTNLVIVGAQIAGSDDGITGTAENFNGALGVSGGWDSTTQPFSTDVSDQPFKIQNIGFITQSTQAQNADLTFNVTIQDGDGDTITQTLDATVTASADSTTPISLGGSVTTISQTPLDGGKTSSFATTSDTQQITQQTTTNSNNVLMGAFAAAGLAASEPLAAHDVSDQSSAQNGLDVAGQHTQAFSPVAADAVSGNHGLDLAAIASDGRSADAGVHNDGASHGDASNFSQRGLDASGGQSDGHAPSALSQGTDAPGGHAAPAALTADGIAMPNAALLAAAAHAHAGVGGQSQSVDAQHNEVVGKVLADSLHGGGQGPDVEALVNSLPQNGNHGEAAADALASHAGSAVPNGDMGAFAGFTGMGGLHMMHQMAHADAVPAHG